MSKTKRIKVLEEFIRLEKLEKNSRQDYIVVCEEAANKLKNELKMGRSTNPLVKINATENIQERIRAVAYFGKLTTEAAMYWCEKQKYRPIEVYPINITVAVYEARERYFKKCNFIEIIS